MGQLAHAHEVESHGLVPCAVGRVDVYGPFAAASAVHENVDFAHGFFSRLCKARGRVGFRDVDDDDVRGFTARGGDFVGQFVEQVFAARDDAGLHPFSGERFGDGATDALACASDQGGLVVQL